MQIYYKEKALLANQYKLEKAEKQRNWIGRNKIKVILFGIFMAVVGPVFNHQPDGIHRTKSTNALDVSDFGHLGTGIGFLVIYTICMLIAYWTGKYQDDKKIQKLKQERKVLEIELEDLKQKS